RGRCRHARSHLALVVGSDALEPADGDRLGFAGVVLLDPATPARRLAGSVAGAPEDAGEDVRPPVDHVGIVVTTGGDQADVFGHRRMSRTRPLTVDDAVEGVGMTDISRLHRNSPWA